MVDHHTPHGQLYKHYTAHGYTLAVTCARCHRPCNTETTSIHAANANLSAWGWRSTPRGRVCPKCAARLARVRTQRAVRA